MPEVPNSGSWRRRPLESEGSGRIAAEPAPRARVDKAPTPEEIRRTIAKLRSGARFHAIFATIFATGSVYEVFDEPARHVGALAVAEDVSKWQIVVMAAGLSIVNVVLALSKRRRAARLAADPDADHPEAKVFE